MLKPAFEVAVEIDPTCDHVLGACVVTEDRLALVKELRTFALGVKIDLERLSIENVANLLEHEIVKSGRTWGRPWGIYDTVQQRWWPRRFERSKDAQAHYNYCKGPGSRGEVRQIPKEGAP